MLKLQCFGHLIQRASSLEKTLMLGKIEDRRRRRLVMEMFVGVGGEGRGAGKMTSFKNMEVKLLSRVRLFATPWTVAYQAPLSMGFSRQ